MLVSSAKFSNADEVTVEATINGSVWSIPAAAITARDGDLPRAVAQWVDSGNSIAAFTGPTLDEIKARIMRQIDDDAEACRQKFLTAGAGMAMTYREKFEQAKAVNAIGQSAANALTAQEYTAAYPTLAASVGIEAATLWDCSQIVIGRYEAFATVSNPIETARLSGKAAVTVAADEAAAQSVYQATKASFDAIAANA